MKNTFFIITGILVVAALGVWAVFSPTSPARDTRPVLAASIPPLVDIVQHVAGDIWQVVPVVPAGASPHSYALSPAQVGSLQGAQAIFMIGHGLDDQVIDSVRRIAPEADTATVDSGIMLREFGEEHGHEDEEEEEHEDEGFDPHYWLSVPNGKQIAVNVAQYLQNIDPEHSDVYAANLAAYIEELDALEAELQAVASDAPQKHFIAVHDAWGYLAQQYGFELVGTFEPVEGREPSPADIRELENVIQEYSLTAFYTEPQKQSSAANRLFSDGLGLEVRVLDPEGGSSYVELMRSNIQTLSR
ncbi:MAG: metal ABC transporter substrate-binding protein [Candidatus Andersenbacteria bacterium]